MYIGFVLSYLVFVWKRSDANTGTVNSNALMQIKRLHKTSDSIRADEGTPHFPLSVTPH